MMTERATEQPLQCAGPGVGQAAESQRLISGPSSSGGDLDSIFDRLGGSVSSICCSARPG